MPPGPNHIKIPHQWSSPSMSPLHRRSRVHPSDQKVLMPSWKKVESENKRIPFVEEFCEWGREYLKRSSLHAVSWVPLMSHEGFKTASLFLLLLIMVLLPSYLVQQMIVFANNTKVITSVEYHEADNMSYPNITICHPKFFNTSKLQMYNLSVEISNYLPMALDPALGNYVKWMENVQGAGPVFLEKMKQFEVELDTVLERNNMTLLQLFRALAISCDKFIFHCAFHRRYFMPKELSVATDDHQSCCDVLFNAEPTFSSAGTCFTSNRKITEKLPSTYNSLTLFVDPWDSLTPELSMSLQGNEATIRDGVYWTLSDERDHPPAVVSSDLRRAGKGTMTMVGLKKTETDRSELNIRGENPCFEDDEDFEALYGVRQTKENCNGLKFHHVYPNCSLAVLLGYNELPGIPPCLPKNMLSSTVEEEMWETKLRLVNAKHAACAYDCRRVDFEVTASSSALNKKSMVEYMSNPSVQYNNVTEDIDLDKVGILGFQFYFQTFSYPKNILTQETYFDMFSKIGGTMGLAIGASIFSFVEIFVFLVALAKIILGRLKRTK